MELLNFIDIELFLNLVKSKEIDIDLYLSITKSNKKYCIVTEYNFYRTNDLENTLKKRVKKDLFRLTYDDFYIVNIEDLKKKLNIR